MKGSSCFIEEEGNIQRNLRNNAPRSPDVWALLANRGSELLQTDMASPSRARDRLVYRFGSRDSASLRVKEDRLAYSLRQ